jgi:hypothetical protein
MSTDPDQIRGDIERTRNQTSDDVDALAARTNQMANRATDRAGQVADRAGEMADRAGATIDKYNPRKAAGRGANRMRDAFQSARDKVMGTANSVGQTASGKAHQTRDRAANATADARQAVGAASDKAREQMEGSPLAAGLIAFGAGLLVSALLPASEAERHAAGRVKDMASQHSDQVKQGLRGAGQQLREGLREPAQHAAEAVKSTASQSASDIKDQGQWAARDVKEQTQQAGQNVRAQQ